jgi:hypothetical protein
LKNNRLATKEAGGDLATALAANSALKELDLSSNAWEYSPHNDAHADGAGFAQELAVGIKDNGAMTSLNLSSNQLTGYGNEMSGKPNNNNILVAITTPFRLTLSCIILGVIALANVILDMGALLVLSLRGNGLGTKEAGKVLGEILKGNSLLKELDLSENIIERWAGGDAAGFAKELAGVASRIMGPLSIGVVFERQQLVQQRGGKGSVRDAGCQHCSEGARCIQQPISSS